MSPDPASTVPGPTLIDAHVHLHACFELAAFFDRAALNFDRVSRELGAAPYFSGVIALTESKGAEEFRRLKELAPGCPREAPGWELRETGESTSVAAIHGDRRLLLVAGRQIRTRERLEVLAIGTRESFTDGSALLDTARDVLQVGALAVLPWGFGKWRFGRRRVVLEAIEAIEQGGLFLGDNGGRAASMRRPRLLEVAESRGIPTLSGSDPLPFPREVARVGGFGSILREDLDARRPAGSLLDRLKKTPPSLRDFGSPASLGGFIRAQLEMRVRDTRARGEV